MASRRTLLVLAQPPSYETLRQTSRFVVLRTAGLQLARTVTLKGDFGYDALSPDGRWLYLLQHRSVRGPEYAVRAYDLRTGQLWKQVIVDKRTPDEKMNGYPVARTSSAAGVWVYTRAAATRCASTSTRRAAPTASGNCGSR